MVTDGSRNHPSAATTNRWWLMPWTVPRGKGRCARGGSGSTMGERTVAADGVVMKALQSAVVVLALLVTGCTAAGTGGADGGTTTSAPAPQPSACDTPWAEPPEGARTPRPDRCRASST